MEHVCGQEYTTLYCGATEALDIIDVWFGRQTADICSDDTKNWGSSTDATDLSDLSCMSDPVENLQYAKEVCQDESYCILHADNNDAFYPWGDDCDGTYKYLTVKYTCNPRKLAFQIRQVHHVDLYNDKP